MSHFLSDPGLFQVDATGWFEVSMVEDTHTGLGIRQTMIKSKLQCVALGKFLLASLLPYWKMEFYSSRACFLGWLSGFKEAMFVKRMAWCLANVWPNLWTSTISLEYIFPDNFSLHLYNHIYICVFFLLFSYKNIYMCIYIFPLYIYISYRIYYFANYYKLSCFSLNQGDLWHLSTLVHKYFLRSY